MGDLVGPDCYFRSHVNGAGIPKHFSNFTQRLGVPIRLPDDLRDNIVAGFCLFPVVWRDENVLVEVLVVRHYERHAALLVKASHYLPVDTLQYFHDYCFPAVSTVQSAVTHHDVIAVHHGAHLFPRQVQVLAAPVRPKKTVTVRVTDYPSGHQVHLLKRAVACAAVADDLAITQHGLESLVQRLPSCRTGDAQFTRYLG